MADGFSPAALAYFESHAISPVTAWSLGVREEAGELLYPYRRDDGMPFYRRRPLDGNKTYQARNVDTTLWKPQGLGPAVLLCEGEADALAAISAGIGGTVAAIPGASFPPDRALRELQGCSVWTAFDGDEAGRRAATGYTRDDGEFIPGIANVLGARVIRLPDEHDLADVLVGFHPSFRAKWIRDAVRHAMQAPPAPVRRVDRGPRKISVDSDLEAIPPPVYIRAFTGQEVRRGFVSCPLPDHEDVGPSCQVWEEPARGWFCHACRRGGSIYDLAAYTWGMKTRGDDFKELKARLADMFA